MASLVNLSLGVPDAIGRGLANLIARARTGNNILIGLLPTTPYINANLTVPDFFQLGDANGDNRLTVDELQGVTRGLRQQNRFADAAVLESLTESAVFRTLSPAFQFNRADLDGNGILTRSEFEQITGKQPFFVTIGSTRPPSPVLTEFQNQQAKTQALRQYFDEQFYLEQNPDVRQAVERGELESGYEHFVLHDQQEGRAPTPTFGRTG